MRINNAGEFYHFVRNNQLVGMAPEIAPMVMCFDEYTRMCQCDTIAAKNSKQEQCRGLYVSFVMKSNQYKNTLFSKTADSTITFCVNGQAIITLNR
jgi:hypothetical protein